MEKKTKKAILLGIGATVLYNACMGKGIFNKPRFYHQINAAKNYLDTYYKGAKMGPVEKTASGWATVVDYEGKKILLSFVKADGKYIFSESMM